VGPLLHLWYLPPSLGRRLICHILRCALPIAQQSPRPLFSSTLEAAAIRCGLLGVEPFGALALTAMLPIFHGISTLGWNRACAEIGAQWYLAEGLMLLFGVTMFLSRLPERLSPGSLDVLGHSHQIYHICAVIGQAFHVAALVVGYQFRHAHPGC
jgi:hypothetical protein